MMDLRENKPRTWVEDFHGRDCWLRASMHKDPITSADVLVVKALMLSDDFSPTATAIVKPGTTDDAIEAGVRESVTMLRECHRKALADRESRRARAETVFG